MRVVIGRVSMGAALLAAAFLAFPLAVSAQSLGEAAERAKKERKGGKGKVITESELRRAGTGEAPVSSSESTEAADSKETPKEAAAGTTPAKAEKTDEELRAEAEAKWRERVQKAQDDVTRLSSEASQLQTALNDVSQNLYGAARTGMMTRLEEVQKQLAAAQQSVSDLQEEGRRSRYRQ
jgi:hypothetical protein